MKTFSNFIEEKLLKEADASPSAPPSGGSMPGGGLPGSPAGLGSTGSNPLSGLGGPSGGLGGLPSPSPSMGGMGGGGLGDMGMGGMGQPGANMNMKTLPAKLKNIDVWSLLDQELNHQSSNKNK